MTEFTLNEMQEMQKQLQETYKDVWGKLCPESGNNQLLWLICELGEVIDIVKKKGAGQIMKEEEVRKSFIEEMADVLMYYNDVMLCYGISVEELKTIYTAKHEKNLKRWPREKI